MTPEVDASGAASQSKWRVRRSLWISGEPWVPRLSRRILDQMGVIAASEVAEVTSHSAQADQICRTMSLSDAEREDWSNDLTRRSARDRVDAVEDVKGVSIELRRNASCSSGCVGWRVAYFVTRS
jgi:hypothetical protein